MTSAPARDDRGGVTASVAVLPMVFTLFFVVIQISLWYHGRSVATAAAHQALEAARAYGSNGAGAGEDAGTEFLTQVGGLDNVKVTVTPQGDEILVTVEADPLTVVPGMNQHITVEMTGPVERIIP